MADSNVINLTENTAPLGSDLEYMVDDPNGTPADHNIYKGSNNIGPDGFIVNGKTSVTVASNNITVAIKTKSGGNPSATDPVSVWINGSYRRITAALSVTKNAGTNWFGSGGAAFATLEQDYFVYLIWNTTPATDIMDIGFARIPYGRVYSEFSTTSTAETYMAFGNASTPTSTDVCINIGRFAATLSATASFNWSVPSYTNANLIQHPILNTRMLAYVPAWASGGTQPAVGDGLLAGQYVIRDRLCFVRFKFVAGASSTYGTGVYTWSLPLTARTTTNLTYGLYGYLYDNNTTTMYIANGNITSGGSTVASMQSHGSTSPAASTVPFTWATSDQFSFQGEYPIV